MKKRNLWYLPPIIAGGFFVVAASALTPIIAYVFFKESLPFSVVTYVFVFSLLKFIFRKKNKTANAWAWIATAWVTVIAMYVIAELRWCEHIGC